MEYTAKRRPRRLSGGTLLALPASAWLILFFLLPLLILLVMSFLTRGSTPSSYDFPLTLDNYEATLRTPYRPVIERSIEIAFTTTLLCFILGYPLAFFISTRRNKWIQQLSLFMVILPFWTNFLVRTYAWIAILGRRGLLNEFLMGLPSYELLGVQIIEPLQRPLSLINTETAVYIGLVYGYLPFMVLPIYATLERFDFRLVEAGHDLGANDWRVFWRVVFPVTLPGIVAGWILVFIPSIGAFVTPDLLGGTRGLMIGRLINQQFLKSGASWVLGSALSMIIMYIVIVALLIYSRLGNETAAFSDSWLTRLRRQIIPDNVVSAIQWWLSLVFTLIALYIAIGYAFRFLGIEPPTYEGVRFVDLLISIGLTLYVYFAQNRRPRLRVEEIDSPGMWLKIQRDLLVRRVGRLMLYIAPIVTYIFLWLPIVLLVIFSFNDSRRSAANWEGFTTRWYDNILNSATSGTEKFSTEVMLDSVQTSLTVSIISTILATTMGTLVALALVRYTFPGKSFIEGLLYLPVVIPDIAQGVALLVFFGVFYDFWEKLTGDRAFPGAINVIIGHVTFNVAFVTIVIRARLQDMNPRYEEAARDLGANEWRTFWKVTYPLLLPGIIAGALLAFTLSMDDFVITLFVGGGSISTLPVYVYGLVRQTITPEINAISTLMILASTILILFSLILQNRSAQNR